MWLDVVPGIHVSGTCATRAFGVMFPRTLIAPKVTRLLVTTGEVSSDRRDVVRHLHIDSGVVNVRVPLGLGHP